MSDGFKFAYLKEVPASMPDNHYRVLVAIWNYSNRDGEEAIASVERIMADTGKSRATVKRSLKWLRGNGWIAQTRRGGRNGSDEKWSSKYSLGYGTIPGEETTPLELAAETPADESSAATHTEPFGDAANPAEEHAAANVAPFESDAETCWEAGCQNPAAYASQLCAEHEHLRCETSWDATPIRPTEPVGV